MKITLEKNIMIEWEKTDKINFQQLKEKMAKLCRFKNEVTYEEFLMLKIDEKNKKMLIPPGRADIVERLKTFSPEIIDKRIEIKKEHKFKHAWGFRDELQKAFVMDFINSKTKNHYGVMSCGGGKTFSALKIAEELEVTTMIVVDEVSLLEQWKEDILDLCGYPEEHLGVIYGTKKIYKDKSIVLATKQTLANNPEIQEYLAERISYLVVDECHTAPTDVYTKAIEPLKPKYRLGLTATPKRQDGNQYLLENMLGTKHIEITQEQMFEQGSTLKPEVICYAILTGNKPLNSDNWVKKLNGNRKPAFWQGVIKQWIAHKHIHKKITELVYKAYKQNRSIVMILKQKNVINMYKEMLVEIGIPEDEIMILVGDTDKEFRKEIIDDMKSFKKKIILTSKLLDKAISIPRLDTVFNVFPTKDETGTEQRLGRLTRLHPEKNKPIFIDFVYDNYLFFEQLCVRKFNRTNVYRKASDCKFVEKMIQEVNPYFMSKSEEEWKEERAKLRNSKSKYIINL